MKQILDDGSFIKFEPKLDKLRLLSLYGIKDCKTLNDGHAKVAAYE